MGQNGVWSFLPAPGVTGFVRRSIRPVDLRCLCLPKGNPAPGPKLNYKLGWFERLHKHGKQLIASDVPFVMAGDYNVMPTDLDVYAPERWRDDALFRPEVRQAYAEFVELGWSDTLRDLNPGKRIYTFWKYFRNAFARDAGLRIDHLLLSPALKPRLVSGGVAREARGWEKTSDHAPAWIDLVESVPRRSRRKTKA
jgi:exodeoxyribonuclease III